MRPRPSVESPAGNVSPRQASRMKHTKKQHLPSKTCPACQRPFTWRKKWARDWDQVRYCSERCRRSRQAAGTAGSA